MIAHDSRARLLAVAEEAFLRDGYGAAKLSDIAVKAGISKKTIYKMVSSKAELLAEVVRQAIATEDISRTLHADDDDIGRPLRAFLFAYAQLSLSQRGADADRLVMSESRQFPELAQAYLESVESAATRPLIEWMRRQVAAGRMTIASPERGAHMLINMALAYPLRSLTLGQHAAYQNDEIAEIVDEAVALFLFGAVPSER